MKAAATHSTFAGARLLEPIERHQHIQFIERRIAVQRFVDEPQRLRHVKGDVACREFAQTFPCPPQSYPAEEQTWIDFSLRKWAKSHNAHTTDQNHLCKFRYNRHIFCSDKILPASQTAAVWQMGIPRIPEVLPAPTLQELIQRETQLLREQRESRSKLSQLLHDYESSRGGQTHSLRLKDVLPEWNSVLSKHGLPNEVDYVLFVLPRKEEPEEDGEIHNHDETFQESSFYSERSLDDEKVNGAEFNYINNNGVRETTRDTPNDRNRRSAYSEKYKHVVPHNLAGKGRTQEAEQAARNHRDFLVDAARHHAQTTNTPVVEIAEKMGVSYDWLRKQLSRGNQTLDIYQQNPDVAAVRELIANHNTPTPKGFNVVIRLNNTAQIKYLGELTDSPKQYLRALSRHHKRTIKDALKNIRKKALANGWTAEQLAGESQAVQKRIEEAYRLPFEALNEDVQECEGNVVTVSS